MKRNSAPRLIGLAGVIVGCLDITSAFIIWSTRGVSPTRGLQGIAVSLLGRSSYEHGWATAALGLALHFFIALSVTTIFYFASRRWPILLRRPILSGVVYGPLVYLVMYWVVVPLSRIGPRPHSLSNDATAILIHIFLIGLPIALMVRYFPQPPVKISP